MESVIVFIRFVQISLLVMVMTISFTPAYSETGIVLTGIVLTGIENAPVTKP